MKLELFGFISHSHNDNDFIGSLYNHLNSRPNSIVKFQYVLFEERYGDKIIDHQIGPMIKKSDFFIVLFTPSGMKSEWVNQEVGYAIANKKMIIPVIVTMDNDDVPENIGMIYKDIEYISVEIDKFDGEGRVPENIMDSKAKDVSDRIHGYIEKIYHENLKKILEKAETYEAEGNTWEAAVYFKGVSRYFEIMNRYEKSIEYMSRARNLFEKIEEFWEVATACMELSRLYEITDDMNNFYTNLLLAAEFFEKDEEPWEAAETYERCLKLLLSSEKRIYSRLSKDILREKAIDNYTRSGAIIEADALKNGNTNILVSDLDDYLLEMENRSEE